MNEHMIGRIEQLTGTATTAALGQGGQPGVELVSLTEIPRLKARIREGERLFKKMLVMSGAELGGPHPIWADVERWLGDPPGSQSDRGANGGGTEHE